MKNVVEEVLHKILYNVEIDDYENTLCTKKSN